MVRLTVLWTSAILSNMNDTALPSSESAGNKHTFLAQGMLVVVAIALAKVGSIVFSTTGMGISGMNLITWHPAIIWHGAMWTSLRSFPS